MAVSMCSPSISNRNKPKSKSRFPASRSNAERSRWHSHLSRATLAFCLALQFAAPASADDPWNPFAERDRRTGSARQPRPPQPDTSAPGEYLAPMTPNARAAAPGILPGGTPYGASPASPYDSRPGTYQPPDPTGRWGGAPGAGAATTPVIERGELSPVMRDTGQPPPRTAPQPSPITPPPNTGDTAPSAPALSGAWAGLDASTAEQLLAPLRLPPASPAMSDLLARFLIAPLADPRLELVRTATLWRSGVALSQPPSANLADAATGSDGSAVLATLLLTKIDLAAGRDQDACARIKTAVSDNPDAMPANLRGEVVVIAGYCAIAAGKPEAGALAAQLARDSGDNRPFTLALLEAITAGGQPGVPLTHRTSLIDGLLAFRLKDLDPAILKQVISNADPGLLGFLAGNSRLPGHLALLAAERAATRNVISPARLAEIYRTKGQSTGPATSDRDASPAAERAALFVAAERNPAQFQKTRDIRALLDSALRDRLYHPVAVALTPIVAAIPPAQEISWFSETAIEALAAGGDYQTARKWVEFARPFTQGAGNLDHWHLLLDIGDAGLPPGERGRGFQALEVVMARGRFDAVALHRLVTVLDALDYNVPIPIWNLASRTEQPQTGHLPETGILSALKKTSENGQPLATTLFALRTLASEGTSATHLLGLGEAIRALKRAGLESDARRLAFEALFADWPRTVGR